MSKIVIDASLQSISSGSANVDLSGDTAGVGGLSFPADVGLDKQALTADGSGNLVFRTAAWNDITGKPTFASVATAGTYSSLSGKPTLGTIASMNIGDFIQPNQLAAVATAGTYASLTGKPTLGTASAAATTDFATALQGGKADTAVQPEGISTVAVSGDYADLLNRPTMAAVASTGAYADLTGRPTLSTVAGSGAYADLTGKPTLSTVASSGAYADLSGKPTIPTALTGLSDIALASITANQVLKYNSGTSKWANGTLALADLSNILLSGVTTNQVLAWDGVQSRWVNKTPDAIASLPDIVNVKYVLNTANVSGSVTIDASVANLHDLTATAAITAITLTAPTGVATHLTILLRPATFGVSGWPASVKWSGGTAYTPSTAAGALDLINLTYVNGTWLGNFAKAYS